MSAPAKPRFLSIAGEQQAAHDSVFEAMDQGDVDQYVNNATPETLECRLGNHRYAKVTNIDFVGVDGQGLLLRRLPCTQCECAVQWEHWEDYKDSSGKQRFRRLYSSLSYKKGPDGQVYTAPTGRGRMTRKQISDALMTRALSDRTLRDIRKAAIEAGKHLKEV